MGKPSLQWKLPILGYKLENEDDLKSEDNLKNDGKHTNKDNLIIRDVLKNKK